MRQIATGGHDRIRTGRLRATLVALSLFVTMFVGLAQPANASGGVHCQEFQNTGFGTIKAWFPGAQYGANIAVQLEKWSWSSRSFIGQYDTVTDYPGNQRYKYAWSDGYGWKYYPGSTKLGGERHYQSSIVVGLNSQNTGATLHSGNWYRLAYWWAGYGQRWSGKQFTSFCQIP